jgi:uncharacterized membrane protein
MPGSGEARDEARAPAARPARWDLGTRLAAVALGWALVALGLRARGPAALVLGGSGALLALRGAMNLPVERLVGRGRAGGARGRASLRVEGPAGAASRLEAPPGPRP